ncbi:MAG: hypothetical protein QM500_11650 [Methylococcales bacterium]
MTSNTFNAKTYVGKQFTAPHSGKVGLCLSGGGSRALSAGLGQLIGLKSISTGEEKSLLDAVDYISSVSGGTWLTSIFCYSSNPDLDDLLGVYTPPNTLDLHNTNALSAGSIGHAPSKLSYLNMIDTVQHEIGFDNVILFPEVRKWIWTVVVGELVLKPFGLYNGSMTGSDATLSPAPDRFFSLDKQHMESAIKSLTSGDSANGSLTAEDFYFVQSGRPFPIMNTNIKVDINQQHSPLLPTQGTPVAVGASGSAGSAKLKVSANGGVESFAFSSSYQSDSSDIASVNIERRYSLIDIVSCSSAFFAEVLGEKIKPALKTFQAGMAAANPGPEHEKIVSFTEKDLELSLASLTPQYPFWPVGETNSQTVNTGFADGGNLDNSGIIGMLARSDAQALLVCFNSETPLNNKETVSVEDYEKPVAQIDTGIPPLFGYQPSPVNNTYVKFSSKTPADIVYLKAAQVFESHQFGLLLNGLYAASASQTAACAFQFPDKLTVVDNPYAGIKNRSSVNVMWIYNNYASDWVDEIHTHSWELADKIKAEHHIPLTDYWNFPNYSTGLQIDLNATQVNTLAQFQAWVINQVDDDIACLFGVGIPGTR